MVTSSQNTSPSPAPKVPGATADQPWLPTPLTPSTTEASATNWAENAPHEADGPYPLPSDWKQ